MIQGLSYVKSDILDLLKESNEAWQMCSDFKAQADERFNVSAKKLTDALNLAKKSLEDLGYKNVKTEIIYDEANISGLSLSCEDTDDKFINEKIYFKETQ